MILLFDKFDLVVKMVGVVNIIVNDDGVLIGYMIDGIGFMKVFVDEGLDICEYKMMLVGVGGVGIVIVV